MAETAALKGRFARRRRENIDGGRQHRHVVKVTPEEEALLLHRAELARVTVVRLLVERALSDQAGEAVEAERLRHEVLVELFAVHRLLGTIANNVNQMTKATNATGEVQDDMRATLAAVRRVAERIDDTLEGMAPR